MKSHKGESRETRFLRMRRSPLQLHCSDIFFLPRRYEIRVRELAHSAAAAAAAPTCRHQRDILKGCPRPRKTTTSIRACEAGLDLSPNTTAENASTSPPPSSLSSPAAAWPRTREPINSWVFFVSARNNAARAQQQQCLSLCESGEPSNSPEVL